MKTQISKIDITYGSSQKQIIDIARDNGCKYVVCLNDHYRGNCKGFFYEIADFEQETKFNWSTDPYDRGVLECYVTSDNIPQHIESRRTILNALNAIESLINKLNANFGQPMKIDGRWSSENSKRIEAERFNKARSNDYNSKIAELNEKKRVVINELTATSHISSTMRQVTF